MQNSPRLRLLLVLRPSPRLAAAEEEAAVERTAEYSTDNTNYDILRRWSLGEIPASDPKLDK